MIALTVTAVLSLSLGGPLPSQFTVPESLPTSVAVPPVDFGERRLILVRHGDVAGNLHKPPVKQGGFIGSNFNVPLSPQGEEEAAALASYIKCHHGDEVRFLCTSPMRTAMESSEKIREAISCLVVGGLSVSRSDLLKELDRGQWANLTRTEVDARWGEDCYERWARESDYGREVADGESIAEVRDRAISVRDYVLRGTRSGSASVIVSHLWILRLIIAAALGEDDPLQVEVPEASVTVIDYQDSTWPVHVASELPHVMRVGYQPMLDTKSE